MVTVDQNPECLSQLGVTVRQSTPADPDINTFEEFLAAFPTKRVDLLCNYETAGFLYINENKEFVAASMILKPRNHNNRKTTVIAQQQNNLAFGPNLILFQVEDLLSHVLVSINKEEAVALQLAYNPLTLTTQNYPLFPKLVGDASFSFDSTMLTALPAVLAVVHGSLLPEDLWDNIMKALTTTKKHLSITGGKE